MISAIAMFCFSLNLLFQVTWFFEQPDRIRCDDFRCSDLYGVVREKPGALNRWSVEVLGGPDTARKVAAKYGFGCDGHVSEYVARFTM